MLIFPRHENHKIHGLCNHTEFNGKTKKLEYEVHHNDYGLFALSDRQTLC